MAMISAHAAWHMGLWDDMAMYVDTVDPPDGSPAAQVRGKLFQHPKWAGG